MKKVPRSEVKVELHTEVLGLAAPRSQAVTRHNGVLDIGLDSPETRGCGSSAGSVDVGIGKRRMRSHQCGAGGLILTGDGV
jgi:hypothetical protein